MCKHERVRATKTEEWEGSLSASNDVVLEGSPITFWQVECEGCGLDLSAGIANYEEVSK